MSDTTKSEPRSDRNATGDLQTSLILASARSYVEHIHFEVPVLEYSSVSSSIRANRPLCSTGDLLYYALIASALPWLENNVISRHGFQNRQEAFESNVESFEFLLALAPEQDVLKEAQGILLMAFAASQTTIKAVRKKETAWLRLAHSKLSKLHSQQCTSTSTEAQQHKHVNLRLAWWSGFIMEQSLLLRSSLEATEPHRPSTYLFDPRGAGPLKLTDAMDGLDDRDSSYWTCIQRAICFLQRKWLCERTLDVVLEQRPRRRRIRKTVRRGQMHHDRYFWKVQTLAQEFTQLQHNVHDPGLFNILDNEGYGPLAVSRLNLELTLCRTLIALHRIAGSSSCEGEMSYWSRMRDERIMRLVRRVLVTARKVLGLGGSAPTSHGASTGLLRAISAAAAALKSLKASTRDHPDYHLWCVECRVLLKSSLETNHAFWMGGVSNKDVDLELVAPQLPRSAGSMTEGSTMTDHNSVPEIMTEEDMAMTAMSQDLDIADLIEPKQSLSMFDDLWDWDSFMCTSPS